MASNAGLCKPRESCPPTIEIWPVNVRQQDSTNRIYISTESVLEIPSFLHCQMWSDDETSDRHANGSVSDAHSNPQLF